MDFEPKYTEEQEQFRVEVQAWLKENMPPGIIHPADPIDLTYEQYQKRRDLGRRLGAKGWLWPTGPAEFGGGGLTMEHSVIIEEEVDNYGLTIPPYYDSGGRLGGASILVWGSRRAKTVLSASHNEGRVAHLAAAIRARGRLGPGQRQGHRRPGWGRLHYQRAEDIRRKLSGLRLYVDFDRHRHRSTPPPKPGLVHDPRRPARHHRPTHGYADLPEEKGVPAAAKRTLCILTTCGCPPLTW